jgi:hypothetical protein
MHVECQKEYPVFLFIRIGKKYGDETMLIDTYSEHFLPSRFL